MQRLIFTTTIFFVMAIAAHGQVRLAPFLGYGNELGLWSLGAQVEVLLNDRMSVSTSFTQYFPEELYNRPQRTAWELNGNLNYYLFRGDVGYLYGLAGLNFTHIRSRTETVLGEEVDIDNSPGLNFGLGSMVRINDLLLPFVEAKYTAGGYSQFTFLIGVKFELGGSSLDDDY